MTKDRSPGGALVKPCAGTQPRLQPFPGAQCAVGDCQRTAGQDVIGGLNACAYHADVIRKQGAKR